MVVIVDTEVLAVVLALRPMFDADRFGVREFITVVGSGANERCLSTIICAEFVPSR